MNFIDGEILLFDKPYGWTSFQLVNKVRWLLCRKLGIKKLKVGHAGTLDPLATGLMVVCTGKATKQITSLMGFNKEYIAEIKVGESTPSFDLETSVDFTFPTSHITKELVEEVLVSFRGEIEQIPPVFSAKQVDGKRSYQLARQGIELELKASKVVIHNLELVNFDLPYLTFQVNCSKGTYIRSLARDIGTKLESGACLSALKRTKIGHFQLSEATSVEEFENKLNDM